MHHRLAFSLIEIAVVLVIIGVLAGVILTAQSLLHQANIRSIIDQQRSYTLAVITFRQKFHALPGDASPRTAEGSGLVTRAGTRGQGDANGILENGTTHPQGLGHESALFWADLSASNLLDQAFTATDDVVASQPITRMATHLPYSKGKSNTYFHVYAVGGRNYYYVGGLGPLATDADGLLSLADSLSPLEAFSIDEKLDDSVPTSGVILAVKDITTNAWQTGMGLDGDCLNTADRYNSATGFRDTVACRLSLRTEF